MCVTEPAELNLSASSLYKSCLLQEIVETA